MINPYKFPVKIDRKYKKADNPPILKPFSDGICSNAV
ncbi:hypothetical protein JY68_05365 [Neisseria meningitidis]|uniref:Uncharacterized protein n=2 Tax=Neisseria meningitidis TaxID=487 RepID=A0A425APD6_NEIME|nr:hypothetical protein N875_09575 [Neisseria meningitidis LNP21362]AVI44572.1 hypothetical protein A6J49_13220 [Neisseria meningitidis]CCA44160.1 hypothetical protein NMALPHA522_0619 [Neisseria meningitidis alpha522]AVI44757.1 hypothetical protein A6J51_13640 [Neisseria meningitidis]KIF89476.1 hypothetical protein NX90_08270 [Neisseria meningitidis]